MNEDSPLDESKLVRTCGVCGEPVRNGNHTEAFDNTYLCEAAAEEVENRGNPAE